MANGIGPTLRDARTRRKLSLEEVESATKIRLRYLRAMENEEWDVLPGGAYSRAFLRTYASYLGLDGERIAEDYRHAAEHDGERPVGVDVTALGRPGRGERRFPGRLLGVLVTAALVAAIVVVGLIGGGDGGSSKPAHGHGQGKTAGGKGGSAAGAAQHEVSLQLVASGEVWVCLLDETGEPLIDGAIMEPGEEQGPFRSKEFAVAFGNGEVSMLVNGEEAEVPPSSSPIGYAIDQKGALQPIPEGERPECA